MHTRFKLKTHYFRRTHAQALPVTQMCAVGGANKMILAQQSANAERERLKGMTLRLCAKNATHRSDAAVAFICWPRLAEVGKAWTSALRLHASAKMRQLVPRRASRACVHGACVRAYVINIT